MARHKIGNRPKRYKFILNPYTDVRPSKCPKCGRPTHPRKFPLLIQVKDADPMLLGKTCRYCTRCEIIIANQDELEAQLVDKYTVLGPEFIGNPYVVLGTVDLKVWKAGLAGEKLPLHEVLNHISEFKAYLDLEMSGGWVSPDDLLGPEDPPRGP